MDDLGLNKWLEETYGTSVEGLPLFRLIWSTGVTEKRRSRFFDFCGDLFIRDVIETREVLKYPLAQDRWVLERLVLLDVVSKEHLITDNKYAYNEIYTFQDKRGEFLPLSPHMLEAAMYLFFKFYLGMTDIQRRDLRMEILAQKELEKKEKIKERLGEGRSPFGWVME